jgi:hypothetical protein
MSGQLKYIVRTGAKYIEIKLETSWSQVLRSSREFEQKLTKIIEEGIHVVESVAF